MPIIYLSIILIFIIILLFSSKNLSPIPYFPSQKIDLPLIVKALNLQNNQTVFDLGAGDGIVIFEAAKKAFQLGLNTEFIAVEINPVLVLILYIRRLFHPNKKNIKIVYGNMFSMNFSQLITSHQSLVAFYLYISPWFLEKVIENCELKIENFSVVSYMYPVKSLKRREEIFQGKNLIFRYDV